MKFFQMHKCVSDEDASPVTRENMIIVCDGLGATGQNKHEVDGQIHTSAHWGAKWVSEIAEDFFSKNVDRLWGKDNPETVFGDFKDFLVSELSFLIRKYNLQNTTRGASIQLLPTTLAMALFREYQGYIEVYAVWAGDSRVYLLSSDQGLQQLSKDDVDGKFDAMEDLGTSNMSNCISGEATNRFCLNYKYYILEMKKNMFLLAASDGCFDYLITPMHFEGRLEAAIEDLLKSDDVSRVGECISSYYSNNYLMDDTTIAGVIFNETDTFELKQQYQRRHADIINRYEQPCKKYYNEIQENEDKISKMSMDRSLRDLRKKLLSYVLNTLEQGPFDKKNRLRDTVLSMQCMAEYNRTWEEYRQRKQESEQKRSLAEKRVLSLRENIWKVFKEEYVSARAKSVTAKSATGEFDWFWQNKQNTVSGSSGKRKLKTDLKAKIKSYTNDLLSCIDNGNMYGYEQCLSIFVNTFSVNRNEAIRAVFAEDKFQPDYVTMELPSEWELKDAYNRAEKNGFAQYARTRNAYDEYNCARREMNSDNTGLKEPIGIGAYITKLGNVFADEFIELPDLDRQVNEGLYYELQKYKDDIKKRDTLKKEIAENRQRIDSLWREGYKDTYEYYDHAELGGKV